MPSIDTISEKLGEYMLKGWVLTDQSCSTPGCTVPLMRSPKGNVPISHFCANCDGNSSSSQVTVHKSMIIEQAASASSASDISRSSTPPTEVSDTLSSPVFAPPPETEQSRRRREQSDRASSEIGRRLLKGWAMLGDECPNTQCYGIPLVRPFKAGGGKDPRMECVICGKIFFADTDRAGGEQLIEGQTETVISENLETPGPTAVQQAFLTPSDEIINPRSPRVGDTPISSNSSALEDAAQALQATLLALSSRLTSSIALPVAFDANSIGTLAETITKVTHALSEIAQLQRKERESFNIKF